MRCCRSGKWDLELGEVVVTSCRSVKGIEILLKFRVMPETLKNWKGDEIQQKRRERLDLAMCPGWWCLDLTEVWGGILSWRSVREGEEPKSRLVYLGIFQFWETEVKVRSLPHFLLQLYIKTEGRHTFKNDTKTLSKVLFDRHCLYWTKYINYLRKNAQNRVVNWS